MTKIDPFVTGNDFTDLQGDKEHPPHFDASFWQPIPKVIYTALRPWLRNNFHAVIDYLETHMEE